ncbi:MAG: outer membrane beta-barrel protein [Marinoscillum sp.]
MNIKAYKFFCISVLMFLGLQGNAQYWYGPKGGVNRNQFVYQSDTYLDSFNVKPSYSFEVGGVFIYQASDMFSVQLEMYYERTKKSLTDNELTGFDVTSKTTNSFISAPALFRVSFGGEPIHYYISGGPRIRYWMGGRGTISLDQFDEFGEGDRVWNRLAFKQKNSNTINNVYAVPEGNRIQYALVAGGGMYFDLQFGGRLLLDFKYTFGHSNMGFNGNSDFEFQEYTERFTYRNNTMSLTASYLFEYDAKGARKGMSTIKASNKKKK